MESQYRPTRDMDLFDAESEYRSLFDEKSNARNLLFAYRLGNAVARAKAQLKDYGGRAD